MNTHADRSGSEYRFNIADIVLTVLAMLLVVCATWWAFVEMPGKSVETVEITARLCIFKVPDGAEGKISLGETLYTCEGKPFGTVSRITYLPDSGVMRAYIDLTVEARNLYNGYGVQCGEETLLFSLGESYELYTKNYGGTARCISITENGRAS